MKKLFLSLFALALGIFAVFSIAKDSELGSCAAYFTSGFLDIAEHHADRFLGKVEQDTARCRGGARAAERRAAPWLDWPSYWGTAGAESKPDDWTAPLGFLGRHRRGLDGALLDLEYQRIELLKFNLYDNSGTFERYVRDRAASGGRLTQVWPQLRLPKIHAAFAAVGADGTQRCRGELIRFRTLTGICNDILNPLMGAAAQPFARNVSFEATFPELELNELARNRHGGRIGLFKPDPQLISRELFTRRQKTPEKCRSGRSLKHSPADAHCD